MRNAKCLLHKNCHSRVSCIVYSGGIICAGTPSIFAIHIHSHLESNIHMFKTYSKVDSRPRTLRWFDWIGMYARVQKHIIVHILIRSINSCNSIRPLLMEC